MARERVKKKMVLTKIEVYVLGDSPCPTGSLADVHYAITEGGMIGKYEVTNAVALTDEVAAQVCFWMDSEPEFFMLNVEPPFVLKFKVNGEHDILCPDCDEPLDLYWDSVVGPARLYYDPEFKHMEGGDPDYDDSTRAAISCPKCGFYVPYQQMMAHTYEDEDGKDLLL